MKNKKGFIGVILSVLISVFLVGLGTYATTTISTNVVTGGYVEAENYFKTNNAYENILVGSDLGTTSTGSWNTFIGYLTGKDVDDGATDNNVAIGREAFASASGATNIAIGYLALKYNTGGSNIGIGSYLLDNDSFSGSYNVVLGSQNMGTATSGDDNIAIGQNAVQASTTASDNVGIGANALQLNYTGERNVAVGYGALGETYTVSTRNTAVGYNAGGSAGYSSNSNNSLFGYQAGYELSTGSNNIMIGYQAGDAVTTGANNIVIGYDIDLSSDTANNYLNIGNTIYGDLGADFIGIADASPSYNLSVDGTASVSNEFYMGTAGVQITTGTASVSGDCTVGSIYFRAAAGIDNIISVCDVTNEWTAADL